MVFKAACDRGAGEHPGALLYAGAAESGYHQSGIGADGRAGKARRDRGRQLPHRGIDRREPGHVRQGKSADGGHDHKIKGGIAVVKTMTLDEAVETISCMRNWLLAIDQNDHEGIALRVVIHELERLRTEETRQEKETDTKC